MTEKEAWLGMAYRCVVARDNHFLCHKVNRRRLNLRPQIKERLWLFRPDLDSDCGEPWWYWGTEGEVETLQEANDQRATACCFLAAMCND